MQFTNKIDKVVDTLNGSGHGVHEFYIFNDRLGVQFNEAYEFSSIPKSFDVLDARLGTCYGCGCNCTTDPNDCPTKDTWITFVHFQSESDLSAGDAKRLLEELEEWAEGLYNSTVRAEAGV